MDKILAIIPARGGSKRILYKNIKNFCGQPIIKYSIDAALKSNIFDEIIVSTDDNQIANFAKNNNTHVPFLRSKKNSDDHATLAEVILEVLFEYSNIGKNFDYFCCILPTAPFINTKKILDSFELLKNSKSDSVISVVRFSYPIQRALKIENNCLKMIWPKNLNKRSQDLMPTYHDSGQFYWMKVEEFLKQKTFFAKKTLAFELTENEVQDIDTIDDWKLAEIKYDFLKNKNFKN
ncbi:pseudaminic acid cytidylyltransferase [Candidatus Babeliales bacterium]|nr:pseudaminic acid cytidylyltransferase [Candidatus Babeliales bacterium]